MRLDAMLGKTSVGIETKIEEPRMRDIKKNIQYNNSIHRFQKTSYRIPASELLEKSVRNDLTGLEKQSGTVLVKKLTPPKSNNN